MQSKIDIKKNNKNFIENALKCLILLKNIKFNWDISQDKFFAFLKENSKKKLEDTIQMTIGFLQQVVIPYLMNFGLGLDKIFEDINFNKIMVTLLFAKFKSGFVLEINSKGISEFLKNLINKKY
jgi:hypothetical protein